MNLHQLVRGAINSVSPDQPVIILASLGYVVEAYRQTPKWAPAVQVMAQLQPVSDKVLQWLNNARENAIWRDAYLFGGVNGLNRAIAVGGDLLYFEGYEWQVDQVLEDWDSVAGWSKVRCVQVRACEPPALGSTERPAGA